MRAKSLKLWAIRSERHWHARPLDRRSRVPWSAPAAARRPASFLDISDVVARWARTPVHAHCRTYSAARRIRRAKVAV